MIGPDNGKLRNWIRNTMVTENQIFLLRLSKHIKGFLLIGRLENDFTKV